MEPEDLFLLEQGPASFSLTIMMLIKSESEPPPETLVFKNQTSSGHRTKCCLKRRRSPVSCNQCWQHWELNRWRMLLRHVAMSYKGTESGWWIMWLAVMSSKSEKVELTLLFPQSKTKAAFWTEGMHSYVLSDWDLCLGDSDSTYDSWARHANIITELDNVKKTEWVSSDAHRLSVDQQQ